MEIIDGINAQDQLHLRYRAAPCEAVGSCAGRGRTTKQCWTHHGLQSAGLYRMNKDTAPVSSSEDTHPKKVGSMAMRT